MSSYAGSYNDGRTATRYEIAATLRENSLEITGSSLPAPLSWPFDRLVAVDDLRAVVPFRIGCLDQPNARLTLDDQRILADLRLRAPQLFGPSRKKRVRTAGLAAAGVVSLALALWFGIPLAARGIAWMTPVSWEVALADQVADELVERFAAATGDRPRVCDGAQGMRALAELVTRLAEANPSPYDFQVQVIDGRLNNAFALPGGRIFIFRGLLEFAESPDELAAVLAHEMAHVTEQHGTQAIVKSLGVSLVFSVLLGDMGGGVIAAAGETLLRLSYSREAETEADLVAIEALQNAGLRASGLGSFFERLQVQESDLPPALQLLSTHPSSESRSKLTEGLDDTGARALSEAGWSDLQKICD